MEDFWRHDIIEEQAVTPTGPNVPIKPCLTFFIQDRGYRIWFSANTRGISEYKRDTAPVNKRTPKKDYICFNCGGEPCFDRSACKAKNSFSKYKRSFPNPLAILKFSKSSRYGLALVHGRISQDGRTDKFSTHEFFQPQF